MTHYLDPQIQLDMHRRWVAEQQRDAGVRRLARTLATVRRQRGRPAPAGRPRPVTP